MSAATSSFAFEPIRRDDLTLLHEWLSRPHVSKWWGSVGTVQDLCERFIEAPGGVRAYIAHQDGAPFGFVQFYVVMGAGDGWWEEEADPGARGMDVFIADANALGKGLGTTMINAFLDVAFSDPAVTVIQADPHPENFRAVGSYARAGFRPVGRVVTPDGPAMLMRRLPFKRIPSAAF